MNGRMASLPVNISSHRDVPITTRDIDARAQTEDCQIQTQLIKRPTWIWTGGCECARCNTRAEFHHEAFPSKGTGLASMAPNLWRTHKGTVQPRGLAVQKERGWQVQGPNWWRTSQATFRDPRAVDMQVGCANSPRKQHASMRCYPAGCQTREGPVRRMFVPNFTKKSARGLQGLAPDVSLFTNPRHA